MSRGWLILILTAALGGCGTTGTPVSVPGSAESAAHAAALGRLERVLDECLAAARTALTPEAAEAAARAVFARWKRQERGVVQFQAQAQRLADGSLQIQLQLQLTDGDQNLQAQRQALLGPLARR